MSQLTKLHKFLQRIKTQSFGCLSDDDFATFALAVKEATHLGLRSFQKIEKFCGQIVICIHFQKKSSKLFNYLIYKSLVYALIFVLARYAIVGSLRFISVQDFALSSLGIIISATILYSFKENLPSPWMTGTLGGDICPKTIDLFAEYILSRPSRFSRQILESQRQGVAWNIEAAYEQLFRDRLIEQENNYKRTEALVPVIELIIGSVLGLFLVFSPILQTLN